MRESQLIIQIIKRDYGITTITKIDGESSKYNIYLLGASNHHDRTVVAKLK